MSKPRITAPSAALGRRVRALREQRGWTMRELARRTGLNHTYLGQVERGERNPTFLTILALADGFDIDSAALVGGLRAAKNRPAENASADRSH